MLSYTLGTVAESLSNGDATRTAISGINDELVSFVGEGPCMYR
jgi:hypothetical protein